MLLNDEDADLCLEHHLNETRLECCVCLSYGWTREETLVMEEDQNIILNHCGHSICKKCLFVITRKLQKNNGGKLLNVKCPFPYNNCEAKIKKIEWELYKLHGFEIACTNCDQINFIHDFTKYQTCWNCSRFACIICDEETCLCKEDNAPRKFSRFFFKNGLPLRQNEITEEMKLNYVKLVHDDTMECPACQINFHKISACNEIHHCGQLKICNVCRYTSFPWESNIDLDHWKTCYRWDYLINGFTCPDNCNGCDKHEENLELYKNTRREQSLKRVHIL